MSIILLCLITQVNVSFFPFFVVYFYTVVILLLSRFRILHQLNCLNAVGIQSFVYNQCRRGAWFWTVWNRLWRSVMSLRLFLAVCRGLPARGLVKSFHPASALLDWGKRWSGSHIDVFRLMLITCICKRVSFLVCSCHYNKLLR